MQNKLILLLFLLLMAVYPVYSQSPDTVSFDDLVKIALQSNYGLLIAQNEAEASKLSNSIGNAGFLPTAAFSSNKSFSLVNSSQEFYDGRSREARGAHNDAFNTIVEVNWTIFDGTRMFVTKSKLAELEKQGMLAVQINAENLYLELARIYYQMVQEQALLQSLNINFSISKERLKLAQKKLEIGSASELDMIQARLDLGSDSSAVLNARARLAGLRADINNLLARGPDVIFQAEKNIPVNDTLDYLKVLSNTENQNKELIFARREERISKLSQREIITDYLPKIALYGDYNYSNSNSETGLLSTNETFGPSYGIRLSYNIFKGLDTKLNYQLSQIETDIARISTEALLNDLRTEIYKTFILYSTALESAGIHEELAEDALNNLTIAIELYRLGQINEIDFREIQLKAISAENNLLNAQYMVRNSELTLLRLSGQLILPINE